MTNQERYKTPQERNRAFTKFCIEHDCKDCKCCSRGANCRFLWLALEAEEDKPLTCPFCGADGIITELKEGGFRAFCVECLSVSGAYSTKADAIAAWNRRVK